MDRNEVLNAFPSDEEFRAAPNYRKKEIVERLISAVLDQFDGEHRDPDRWEAEHIAAAIGYLLSDRYFAAAAAAVKALAPSSERAEPDTWARAADTVTARALRHGLEYATGKPARNA